MTAGVPDLGQCVVLGQDRDRRAIARPHLGTEGGLDPAGAGGDGRPGTLEDLDERPRAAVLLEGRLGVGVQRGDDVLECLAVGLDVLLQTGGHGLVGAAVGARRRGGGRHPGSGLPAQVVEVGTARLRSIHVTPS
ncbi:hypothetical protein GCM10009584_18280 [Ornithinimicrobium humiphilum]